MCENKIIKFVQLNKCVINTTRSLVRFISFYFASFMGVKGRYVHSMYLIKSSLFLFFIQFKFTINNPEIRLI